jgi:hypothetical protein
MREIKFSAWDKRIIGGWRNDLTMRFDGVLFYESEPIENPALDFIKMAIRQTV